MPRLQRHMSVTTSPTDLLLENSFGSGGSAHKEKGRVTEGSRFHSQPMLR